MENYNLDFFLLWLFEVLYSITNFFLFFFLNLPTYRVSSLAVDCVLPETPHLRHSLHRRLYHRILTCRDWHTRCTVDGARQDW